MEPQTPVYKDKNIGAVLTLVVTLIANAVAKKFGYQLNVEEISALALTIIAFVVSHKWAGSQKAKAAAAAEAAKEEVKSLEAAATIIGDGMDKQ